MLYINVYVRFYESHVNLFVQWRSAIRVLQMSLLNLYHTDNRYRCNQAPLTANKIQYLYNLYLYTVLFNTSVKSETFHHPSDTIYWIVLLTITAAGCSSDSLRLSTCLVVNGQVMIKQEYYSNNTITIINYELIYLRKLLPKETSNLAGLQIDYRGIYDSCRL